MTTPLAVVTVTSAAALAAGCGGVADEEATNRAADEQATATSARVIARGEVDYGAAKDAGVSPLAYIGEGVYDWERKVGRFETTYGEQDGEGFSAELIALPDAVYTSMMLPRDGQTTKRWVRSESMGPFDGGPLSWYGGYGFAPADPADVLAYLRETSDDVELVGWETVRGIRTAHYRGELDWEQLGEQLGPRLRDLIDPLRDQAKGKHMTMEVWADRDSLARRLRVTMPPFDTPFRLTLEFSEFGAPVDVQAPPADDVMTQEELMKLAQAGEHGCVNPDPENEPAQPDEAKDELGRGWTSYSVELCLIPFETRQEGDQ